MTIAQLTDTHIVRDGATYLGIDSTRYLAETIDAVNALEPQPTFAVVTGDIANSGRDPEYARFRETMSALRVPYFVIPGNHDDRDRMRAALPPETYGGSRDGHVRYAIDDFAVRLIGLDGNAARPWPGAYFDRAALAWLDATLAAVPDKPTIVCVHQPPFRTGLHYLDAGGFIPRRRLRRIVEASPHVARVISGHIHCVRHARWRDALAITAPSTAPQVVPLVFSAGRAFGVRHERAGFAVHEFTSAGATTTIHRRTSSGSYAIDAVFASAGAR